MSETREPLWEFPYPNLPENADAPCNICGRGWPYHVETCAYYATAIDARRLRSALGLFFAEFDSGHEDAHFAPTDSTERLMREALKG